MFLWFHFKLLNNNNYVLFEFLSYSYSQCIIILHNENKFEHTHVSPSSEYYRVQINCLNQFVPQFLLSAPFLFQLVFFIFILGSSCRVICICCTIYGVV